MWGDNLLKSLPLQIINFLRHISHITTDIFELYELYISKPLNPRTVVAI